MTEVKETSLLAEGLRSYPKALGALNEFARSITSTIREVAIQELGSLSSAMHLDLKPDEVGDYVRPNRLAIPNPKDPILGARIDRIGKSGWGIYYYLWWAKGVTNLSVSVWLRDSGTAESVFSVVRDLSSTTRVELYAGHEVCISQILPPDDAEQQLTVIMRELIKEFSTLWVKASGLDRFLGIVENRG
jgi:hypothetical protein